jgi:sialate O-acetylesterase
MNKDPQFNWKKLTFSACFILLLLSSSGVMAAIKLPAIFGDNMVLQRNAKVPLWGLADPGEQVQIVFKGKAFKAVADKDGKWSLKLDVYTAGGPYQMLVKANSGQVTIKNILIGDVWLTSGQSNMEFGIQTERNGAEAIAKATDTLIHFFYVPMAFALQPQTDIPAVSADSPNGKWVVCSPKMMADPKWAWHGFSAAGYYFAQQIRHATGSPVGMIATYKGGTPAQAWISIEGLQQQPSFNSYVAKHQTLVDNYENAKAIYPQQVSTYKDALKLWNEEVGKDYAVITKQWEADVAQAKANGQKPPLQPKPARPAPQNPTPPEGGFGAPANLYNAMVAPMVPYGIKGVIWYQGESNGDRITDAVEYKDLFPRLIADWRANWHQGKLPFIFVQIANYRAPAVQAAEGNWPWVREAQLKALALPETGMAVITDIGEADNIHPKNKRDVGLRLALAARHAVYGENIVFSGPIYKSMKIEGNKIRLTFNNIGSGLTADTTNSISNAMLKGFGIAADDQKFVWAKAAIEGNTIVVWADELINPVAVRYNWADNPPGNLYNKEKLPASPFRTDNWAPPLPPANVPGSLSK